MRPKNKEEMCNLSVRLPVKLKEEFLTWCKARDICGSQVMRNLVKEKIAND